MKIWILQTGEFLQIDGENVRPMRAINLSEYFLKRGHSVNLLSSDFSHQMKLHRYKNLTVKNLSDDFQITMPNSLNEASSRPSRIPALRALNDQQQEEPVARNVIVSFCVQIERSPSPTLMFIA